MNDQDVFGIFFLRHGESIGNAERRWQGQADFPLTDKGREQARALANRWLAEGQNFDCAFTSPQKRAKETAEIIAEILKIPLEVDPIWVERNIGGAAGLTGEEANQRFPTRNNATPFAPIIGDDGEGNWELYLRAGRALHNLLNREPGKYLVVSHGGILNQVMHAVVGIAPQADFRGPHFRFKNTGFAHLTYRPQSHQWQINSLNNHSHWNGKGSD